MGIISTLVVGLIAGALAKLIMPGKQGGGIIVTMLLGIVGAFVASFAGLGAIFGGGFLGTIISAVIGAIIVLLIYGLVMGKKKG